MDTAALPSLEDLPKDDLLTPSGARYKDFRRGLTPRYGRVWADLLAGHAFLGVTALGLVAAQAALGPLWPVAVPAGALALGYGMAYVQLFFHEAAHYNLAPDRGTNDALANLFVGSLVGQDIRAYRPIHWEHHRLLGTTRDTERTYFDPLNVRFVVESLTGIKLVRVLLGRERAAREKRAAAGATGAPETTGAAADPASEARAPGGSLLNGQLVLGLALHGAVVGGAVLTGQWALAGAWVLGTAAVFPFFAAVRQVLEHRSTEASPDVDYRAVPHGVVNRLFGDGLLARTLGGAGFNRHLLHHWDPQLSYTRLKDLEDFLMDTPAAPALRAAKTTYAATFAALMRAGVRRG